MTLFAKEVVCTTGSASSVFFFLNTSLVFALENKSGLCSSEDIFLSTKTDETLSFGALTDGKE